ncbi:MAG: hypothetical protein HY782_25260 [Chloroflexi bacterium]|nr:hypothetical protein [Chloroflexota bacterium]
MQKIALSFFALDRQDFSFTVYRKPYQQDQPKPIHANCKRRKLPEYDSAAEVNGEYGDYWVSLDDVGGVEPFTCNTFTNIQLTLDLLFHLLKQRCSADLLPDQFILPAGLRKRIIMFVIQTFDVGKQIVWLDPYFLKTSGKFGFLADFKLYTPPNTKATRRIQQLSLSLDKDGRSNRNFYAQRYEKIQQFNSMFYDKLFPLGLDSVAIKMQRTLFNLDADRLETKNYEFADGKTSTSQFKGLLDSKGPYRQVKNRAKVYFVYRNSDKPFSHDLFRALRGETFESTFPGMSKMFGYELTRENVGGVELGDFSPESIEKALDSMQRDAGGRPVVPVLITPFSKDTGEDASRSYHIAKHTFLKHCVPSQFVSLIRLQLKDQLKWSVSNIGLQLFAKMGGQPWIVTPHTDNCLIIGLAEAHRKSKAGVEKYFAYSILTESTGLYKDLKVLGQASSPDVYIGNFKKNLELIFDQYHDQYSSFAVHATFSIRGDELDAVKETLDKKASDKEFVVLKIDDDNKYFGYSLSNNSLVPYESSFVKLSDREYLVWFEGLQYHNPIIRKRIGRPLHIEFLYPRVGLTDERKLGYVQDTLNLSGANWRGFNAKSLPISIYYAYLVARYYKEFQELKLEEIDLEVFNPWFL